MRNLKELYSESARDFLRTWEMKRAVVYIVVGKSTRSQE